MLDRMIFYQVQWLVLLDTEGNVVASTTADEQAGYEFGVEPDFDYTIAAVKDEYFDNSASFTTKNLAGDVRSVRKRCGLRKRPWIGIACIGY